jgi:hypothetical protein
MGDGGSLVALSPAFRRALDVAEHRRGNRFAVSRREQRQQSRFLALQIGETARSHRRKQDRAGAQRETVGRKIHCRADRNGTLLYGPRTPQAFVQHGSPFRI